MPRLYIVEGLPCSGKSCATDFLVKALSERGQRVIAVDKGSLSHPADYEYHAFVTMRELQQSRPDDRLAVLQTGTPSGDGWIVPLSRLEPSLAAELMPFKIYDGLPWAVESPLMLEKWRYFVRNAEPGAVYVFNCVLLQNPMCETMMRFDMPLNDSLKHIQQIARIIAPLDPTVIYLESSHIVQNILAVADQRPDWLETVTDYHMNGAYCQRIRANGLDGLFACLEERQRRELKILKKLPLRSLVLKDPARNWESAYVKIEKLIKA